MFKNKPTKQNRNKKNKKKQNKIVGKGSYSTSPLQMLGEIGGKFIGGSLGKLVGSITGLGDYDISKNSLFGSDPPPLDNTGKKAHHSTRISHREYLRDVIPDYVSGGFTSASFDINPTNRILFPWLSGIALNYQYWRPMGIVFEFVSTAGSAVNSTNLALGSVAMATNYNANALIPKDAKHLLNMEYSCTTKPSENLMHGVECDPKQMVLPLLYTTPPQHQAGKAYDGRFDSLGTFTIATFGGQPNPGGTFVLGQLWVTYDVELFAPYLESVTSLTDHFSLDAAYVTVLKPLGTANAPTASDNSNGGTTIDQTAQSIVFPSGTNGIFKITYIGAFTSSAVWTSPVLTGSNGAVAKNLLEGNTASVTRPNGAGYELVVVAYFSVGDLGDSTLPTITFDGSASVFQNTNPDTVDVTVEMLNYTS